MAQIRVGLADTKTGQLQYGKPWDAASAAEWCAEWRDGWATRGIADRFACWVSVSNGWAA